MKITTTFCLKDCTNCQTFWLLFLLKLFCPKKKKIPKNPCTFGNFLSIKHIKSVMHFPNNCYDCNKMFVDFSHSLPYIEVFRDIPLSSRVWSPSRPYSTYHVKLTQTTLDLLNQKLTKELKVTIHILILSVEKRGSFRCKRSLKKISSKFKIFCVWCFKCLAYPVTLYQICLYLEPLIIWYKVYMYCTILNFQKYYLKFWNSEINNCCHMLYIFKPCREYWILI